MLDGGNVHLFLSHMTLPSKVSKKQQHAIWNVIGDLGVIPVYTQDGLFVEM